MQLRFLAAAGPAPLRKDLERKIRQRRSNLVPLFGSDSLSLWGEACTPVLSDAAGVSVGIMFDRATGERRTRLAETERRPESIIRDCWGAYVHFERRGAYDHAVLRDPSGSIPVYYGEASGLDLYASDSEMLRLGWSGSFEPNLDAARQWLILPFLRTRTTGARGVSELLPGSLREVSQKRAGERQLWSPTRFVGGPTAVRSFSEATAVLREEILRTVRLLVAGERVVLRLSGGLDSSIMAAALARAGADVRAVTFATRSRDGDERHFARTVADHFGISLQELSEADLDFSMQAASDPLRRPPNPILQPLRDAFASASKEGASVGVVLDGGGGDNVFGSLNSAAPVVDAFRTRGSGEAFRVLRDIACLHGCNLWEAGRAAARRWRRNSASWPEERSFLRVSSASEHFDVHPWLANGPGLLPGAAEHIRMIAGAHHFLEDPRAGEPVGLHPLLAQPVVELCLRIPSWLWCAGGRDRAAARAAFRGLVPDAIIDRRSKGTLESMFLKAYMAKRAELGEFLICGRLAEEGIIDPTAIKDYLDWHEQPGDAGYIRILEITSAEQWLRSFGTRMSLPAS